MKTSNYYSIKEILWGKLINFVKNKKTPNDKLFYLSMIFIIILFGFILINLVGSEVNRNINSKQCTGNILNASLGEPMSNSRDIFSKSYNCSQFIISENVYSGVVDYRITDTLSSKESIKELCQKKIGNKMSGHCYDGKFREHKSSDDMIGIVFLLGIFILAGKLGYNHFQRKKNINP